jgi:hypothetical protein
MVLSIEIPPQTETRLRQQAEAAGKDVRTYVTELVEQAAERPALDEVLADLRRQFAATGISDDELIRDLTEAQAEHRADKQKKTA